VLAVIATRDDITTAAATAPIVDALPGTDVELMPVDAGHASLFSGRKAVGKVMPGIFDWLSAHSQAVEETYPTLLAAGLDEPV
jgi:polyhydroxyalkanoate synthase